MGGGGGGGSQVIFKKNITQKEKIDLMQQSICLLYTPPNEHFGIVPIESMYCRTPVIACNSGGPRESILNEETGFLLEENEVLWG